MNEIQKFTGTKNLNLNFTNLIADNAPQITKLVPTFSQPILRTNCWAYANCRIPVFWYRLFHCLFVVLIN